MISVELCTGESGMRNNIEKSKDKIGKKKVKIPGKGGNGAENQGGILKKR